VLLKIAVFNLLHQGPTLEEVALEIGGELARDNEKLVVGHFGKRDGAARGDQMRAPMEDQASIPEYGDSEQHDRGGESGALGAETLSSAVE